MKIKYKVGNTEFSIAYLDNLEGFNTKDNPFGVRHTIPNLEFFNNILKNSPSDMMNYYKEVYKAFEEYLNNIKKANDKIIMDNSKFLLANGHDIYNYVARYDLANFQIQAVLKFDDHLDFKKLSRTVRLSAE